jgi:surface polysaccharide O-acyltransferase-like enzyme
MPLLFWSTIYIFVRVSIGTDQISLPSALRLFYNAEVYYHLGFLYSLLAVYAAIPILAPLAAEGRRHLLLWFCAGSLMFSSLIPFRDKIMTEATGHPFHLGMPAGVFWGYLGYAVAGALFRGVTLRRWHFAFAVLGFVTSTACTTILSIRESLLAGEPTEAWMGYDQLFVVVASLLAFVLLLSCSVPRSLSRLLRILADCSFGVYLSHPLVMDLLGSSGLHPSAGILLGLPVYLFLVCGLSLLVVSVLRLLPLGRSVV